MPKPQRPMLRRYAQLEIKTLFEYSLALLGKRLQQGLLTTVSTPLPVLGVPGWWQGQDAAFYAQTSVFRPKRTA